MAGCCGGCRAVDRGRGSQVESMAIVDLSVVTVFPSLRAVGSWEEVLLFSMEFVLQDANFCLKKLALAFLTAARPWLINIFICTYSHSHL